MTWLRQKRQNGVLRGNVNMDAYPKKSFAKIIEGVITTTQLQNKLKFLMFNEHTEHFQCILND